MKKNVFVFWISFIFLAGLAGEMSASGLKNPADSLKKDPTFHQFNIGLGVGMDYGGLPGVRLTYLPSKYVGVFAAGGYALIGLGFNAGLVCRTLPHKKVCPYFTAMYGYNALIKVTGASQYDEIYYGPSFSVGLECRSYKFRNYFNVELLLPLRSKSYYDDMDAMRKNPSIQINSEPTPVGFSIGYHFVL